MKRPKGNILAWLRDSRKTKPKMMEIEMTKLNELIALSRKLLALWLEAKAEIAALKSANRSLSERVAELEAINAAHDDEATAFMAEAMGHIDAGGSTGGVVG